MNLAIVYGGISNERGVSLKTGESIISSLEKEHKIISIDFKNDYDELFKKIKKNKIDLIFNALHGGDGENGIFQSYLENYNIKFTGSSSKASKIAMCKNLTKKLCDKNLIQTPKWEYYDFDIIDIMKFDYSCILEKFKDSCVIKPADEGSSIGMTILDNRANIKNIKNALFRCIKVSKKIIIEEYVNGKEFTVSILGNQALPIVEILPNASFYDFKSKYTKGECNYIIPAKIDSHIEEKIILSSLELNKIVGCRHYSRVDLKIDNLNNIYILEINTLPGMTDTSLFPKSAESFGISYKSLICRIIDLARR